MPPPRASRLASRKSVLPDPSLYDNLTDSDSEQPKRQQRSTTRNNTSTTSAANSLTTAAPAPAPPTKRRTRASLDSADDRPPSKQSKGAASARAKADAAEAKGRKAGETAGGGSRARARGAAEEEEGGSELEEGDSRASKASSSRATKKAKTGANGVNGHGAVASTSRAVDLEEEEEEPVRRGFVPRAAARAGFKPKAGPSSSQARGGADEGELPPRGKDPAPSRRAGGQAKDTSKSKARHQSPSGDQSRPVYAPAVDTPKNRHNKSYREGIPATPGTVGAPRSTGRRTSTDNRGKRASAIGTGFEAGPHKNVPSDKLFRHAGGAEVPLAHRMRSVLSWAGQRQRDAAFPARQGRGGVAAGAGADPAAAAVEAFIGRVCASQVNVSARAAPVAGAGGKGGRALAPHPQNVANELKMRELREVFVAIEREQGERDAVAGRYEEVHARRAVRRPEAVRALGPVGEGELSLAGLTLGAGPRTMEEAVRLGRELLAGHGGVAAGDKKGKGKEAEADPDPELVAVRLKIAAFKQATHRLSSFAHLGHAFVAARSAQTHAALEADAVRGLATATAASGLGAGDAAQDGARRALATGIGGAGAGVGAERIVAGLDPRDLLRAISATDQKSRGLA